MSFFATIEEKWNTFDKKTAPGRKKIRKTAKKTGRFFRILWAYIYNLRGVILSVPVAIAAIWLACMNMAKLPERVGLILLSTGEFSWIVSRAEAVFAPLMVTGLCIVLVLFSKRTLYPWLISIFSLVLPLLIQFVNIYPA